MNLEKLFETQKALDERIIDNHRLQDMDRLPHLTLALQVELGELAQNWRGFKFWSEDQEPRTKIEHLCIYCIGDGFDRSGNIPDPEVPCVECQGSGKVGESNPLLEELVDCLHFILSIGLYKGYENMQINLDIAPDQESVIDAFLEIMMWGNEHDMLVGFGEYQMLFSNFYNLSNMLGFTWDQVEQAYFEKNQINHERQANGY